MNHRNAVAIATTTTGTGALTLGTVFPSHRDLTAADSGLEFAYRLEDANGVGYEHGYGVYTHSGRQFTRVPFQSSNGDAAISLSAGTHKFFIAVPASWFTAVEAQMFSNGFVDRSETTLSWDDGTRTLTVGLTGDSFRLFSSGILYEFLEAQTFQISDVEGLHFIYVDGDGQFAELDNYDESLILQYCLVAVVSWDATNGKAVPDCLDERHSSGIPPAVHWYLHNTVNTAFEPRSGLVATITADGDGDLNSHAQFSSTQGTIWDEDLEHVIAAHGLTDQIPLLWRESSNWRSELTSFLVKKGPTFAYYNENANQLTEVGNLDFVLAHVYAIPGLTHRLMIVMGQEEYTTTADAREGALVEINNLQLMGLPLPEFVWVLTAILQTSSGYTNAVASRVRSTDEGEPYVDGLGVL